MALGAIMHEAKLNALCSPRALFCHSHSAKKTLIRELRPLHNCAALTDYLMLSVKFITLQYYDNQCGHGLVRVGMVIAYTHARTTHFSFLDPPLKCVL
jgi:hypothetical protein